MARHNKYDDEAFFLKYSRMERSRKGLEGAGEWHALKAMMPDFQGKRVLDLGCGFGWHCRYAAEQGAASVLGIDLSERMLAKAVEKTEASKEIIRYQRLAIEDMDFPEASFDVVISSLALHYVPSFSAVCRKLAHCLVRGGDLVFSVEHPIFTAQGTQDWHKDEEGNRLHWPVDRYFGEGERKSNFLGEEVIKHHKTLTTYVSALLANGFEVTGLVEPEPDARLLETIPEMQDELRRPMMLLISARKK
ncbi:Phthiotriol/phenolphthiotriol dimycocerosates methyltransferase [Balamuthia mandrillaris]